MEYELYDKLKDFFDLPNVRPNEVPPLMQAHIGDGVYELIIRTITLSYGNRAVNKLHHDTIKLVNAKTQADIADIILPELTEEELKEYKRGRNAKSNTSAKNASIRDYRKATGLEALIGYLFLSSRTDRACELIKIGLSKLNNEGGNNESGK